MNVLLFGATGMVGQGVLRECLLDPGVQRVLTVARGSTARRDERDKGTSMACERGNTTIDAIIQELRTPKSGFLG